MKNWTKSSDFISATEVDSIIGRIKAREITDHDLDTIIGTIIENSDIKTYSFKYVDISFTGNYQQKLLVSISNERLDIQELKQSMQRFSSYFKDVTKNDYQEALMANTKSFSFSLFACITDEVEDVFNYS